MNKSIELLIKSIKLDFPPSTGLLCIALIKLFGFDIDIILEELNKLTENSINLQKLIYNMINENQLLYEPIYEFYYQSLSTVNYLYDFYKYILSTSTLNELQSVSMKFRGKNITKEFYEGFGINLEQ